MRPLGLSCLAAAVVALAGAAACTGSSPDASSRGGVRAEPSAIATPAPSAPIALTELDGWTETEHAAHGDPARGAALVRHYECNRCHEGTGEPPPPMGKQCTGCHALVAAGKAPVPRAEREALQVATRHYLSAPSLLEAGRTLRASWIAGFLEEPTKVRPHVEEWMPRLSVPEADARDIAAYLTTSAPPPAERPLTGDVARGAEIVASKGCFVCHELTGATRAPVPATLADVPAEQLARGVLAAPDLRYARDRVRPDEIVQWIRDPKSVRGDAVMPTLGLSDDEARDAAAYILATPLAPLPPPPSPIERLPLLSRRVGYEEVATRVFRRSCVHCHADPDASGDGGPGSTGGFGFPARGVRLLSFGGTQLGYLGDDGQRRSMVAPEPALARWGGARIVAALVARHEETSGRPVAGVRGMPMGLPGLSREDIQLVETWAAEGAPFE